MWRFLIGEYGVDGELMEDGRNGEGGESPNFTGVPWKRLGDSIIEGTWRKFDLIC